MKLDERNHVEKPLLYQLELSDWDLISFIQDLLTGRKRVNPLLTEPQEAGA